MDKKIKYFIRFIKYYNYYNSFHDILFVFIFGMIIIPNSKYYTNPYYMWSQDFIKLYKRKYGNRVDRGFEIKFNYNWCMFLYENNLYENVFEGFKKLYDSIAYNENPIIYTNLSKIIIPANKKKT